MPQMTKTVAIIQGRMSSSRLPGKVLQEIMGHPMLYWVVERARRAKLLDQVVVATTLDPSDDPIEDFCVAYGYPVYRGNLYDVLDRYYQAALQNQADVIVRLTADCPLIDPDVIDLTLKEFFRAEADFAANRLPPPWKRTFPIGLDTEVCSFQALEKAWIEADQPYQREHVMPYLYEKEGRFRVQVVNHEPDYGTYRWTVDTPQDMELIRQIFPRLPQAGFFSWKDVLELEAREPELFKINAGVHHKTVQDVDERMNKS